MSGGSPHALSGTPRDRLRGIPRRGDAVAVGEDGERRDHVLAEVLVLVVADDHERVRREGVDRGAYPVAARDERLAVADGGRGPFVVAPLLAHRRRPPGGLAQRRREVGIVEQEVQGGGEGGVGPRQRREVGHAHPQQFPHLATPRRSRLRFREFI